MNQLLSHCKIIYIIRGALSLLWISSTCPEAVSFPPLNSIKLIMWKPLMVSVTSNKTVIQKKNNSIVQDVLKQSRRRNQTLWKPTDNRLVPSDTNSVTLFWSELQATIILDIQLHWFIHTLSTSTIWAQTRKAVNLQLHSVSLSRRSWAIPSKDRHRFSNRQFKDNSSTSGIIQYPVPNNTTLCIFR